MALVDSKFTVKDITTVIRSMADAAFDWHCSELSAENRFGFPWEQQETQTILKRLDAIAPPGSRLGDIARHRAVFGRHQTLKTFTATCHGDLNTENFIIGISSRGTLQPCLIDFSAATEGIYSPALDWARLERDVKLRWLREKVQDVGTYTTLIRNIDDPLPAGTFPIDGDETTTLTHVKCMAAIRAIRKAYLRNFRGDSSKFAEIDYVYNLLCWNLAYVDTEEFAEAGGFQKVIVDIAADTLEILERLLSDREAPQRSRQTERRRERRAVIDGERAAPRSQRRSTNASQHSNWADSISPLIEKLLQEQQQPQGEASASENSNSDSDELTAQFGKASIATALATRKSFSETLAIWAVGIE